MNGKSKWIGIASVIAVPILGLFSWVLIHVSQLDRDSAGFGYNITALSEANHAQSQLNASMQTTVSSLQNTTGLLDQRLSATNAIVEQHRQSTNDSLKEIRQKIDGVDDKLTQILIRLGGPRK